MLRLLLFVLLPLQLAALGQSVVSVAPQKCVWRAGDGPGWSAQNLDESGWRPLKDKKLPQFDSRLWFRCQANLSSLRDVAHPAIQVFIPAAYQLFLNGQQIGEVGDLRSGSFSTDIGHTFQLSQPVPQNAAVTLRVANRFVIMSTSGLLPSITVQAGDEHSLSDRRAAMVLDDTSKILKTSIFYSVIGIFGFVLLGLYLSDRSRIELLLLSLECLSTAAIYLNLTGEVVLLDYPARTYATIYSLSTVVSQIVYPWFFFRLAQRRVPLVLWVAIALASFDHALWAPIALLPLAPSSQLAAFYSNWAAPIGFGARVVVAFAPFIAFWPYWRISRRMLPLAIPCLVWGTMQVLYFLVRLSTWQIFGLPDVAPRWNLVLTELQPVTSFCVVAVLMGLLFREQRKVAEESAEMAGELQAASQIQHMLAPAVLDCIPGIKIDVAYHPMREVGGDFYLCRVLPGGRQRVLVGDVSGKGAAAAMTAALLLGRATDCEQDTPASVLSSLNRVLVKSRVGGFATCLCADLAPNGDVILANAGHLPPYCRGDELKIGPGLPLGIAAETDFAETALDIDVGETLTFLSDAVVEARNAAGELFGFERARALSSRPAPEIAQAAQAFGQDDDITVLTLTFSPVGVVAV
jgi:hypothetical protein